MQFSCQSLWRLSGEALALCYRGAEHYETRLTKHSWLVLSGEPAPDLNYAFVDAGRKSEHNLKTYVAVAKARKIGMLILLPPASAQNLKPVAEELGLQFAEHLPWMTYQPAGVPLEKSGFQIARVENGQDLKAANTVIALAINVNVDSVNRAFGPLILQSPGLELFVAKQDGQVVSTVQTTRAGSAVGIWAMATAPDQQRKGAAKALLNHVIAYHCQRGADLFYLGATSVGKPLYEKVGFTTMCTTEVWVLH